MTKITKGRKKKITNNNINTSRITQIAAINIKKTSGTRHFLCASNLISDHQYGFCKGGSTGDLLGFLTDSWSSSLSCFGETFAVTLNIWKAFDRVFHKSKLSKLPSFGFYPSLCTFIFSFLSGRFISAVLDGHCFKNKPINNCVSQGSVLSPALFLLFINDLSKRNCLIHSYADDSALHYSFFQELTQPTGVKQLKVGGCRTLTSDLSIISDWGRRNLVSFIASKTHFLHLSTRHNPPDVYPYSSITHNFPLLPH